MRKKQSRKMRWMAIVAAVVLMFRPAGVFAVESVSLPVAVVREDVVALELPIIDESETSVFDFILDPQKLLYITQAARFGGGTVEEGATLLFQNSEGQYDFSKYSDQLTVTNRSTVPVRLTISACIADLGELQMVGSDDFADSEDCCIYMAVVDSQGNVFPLSADGEVSIHFEMQAAPENTYVYRLNEELQTYQLELSKTFDEIDFDKYSFGLVGACNPNADWRNVSVYPMVTVTWRVEPVLTDWEEDVPVTDDPKEPSADDNDSEDTVTENTVSGNL